VKDRSGVVLVARKNDWGELLAAGVVGFLCGVAASCGSYGAGLAHAGGPTVVTWDQATDCASVQGWELLQAPITTANPNPQPTAAVIGVTIANNAPPCGLNMTRTVTLAGVGPTRFWLRAVASGGKSGVSNAVEASLPLAPPASLSVVVP
jgi:hypothetical protein